MTPMVALLLLLSQPAAERDQALVLLQEANRLYQDGDFAGAIRSYRSSLELGYESAALHYNLGNAYFKTRQIGPCILCYERAKRLAPGDTDIAHNLQMAQLYIVDKIEVPPPFFLFKWWSDMKKWLGIDLLGLFALVTYNLFMVLIFFRLLVKKQRIRTLLRVVHIPATILFVFASIFFTLRLHEEKNLIEGVVIVDRVDVKSSPADDGEEVFALHEGIKVRITESSGEYVRILLADGKVGWLHMEAVERI